MTRIWTPEPVDPALRELARTPRLLVALDFDGTVSPHTDDPMASRGLPEAVAGIDRLVALPDTVVAYVSGRSLHDLRHVTEHVDASRILLAGSHGAQYWFPEEGEEDDDRSAPEDRAEVVAEVRRIIDAHPGVVYEPKTFGFGVHTRTAPEGVEDGVFAEVEDWAAARIPGWRRRTGHHLREFSWRDEGKDAAVRRLRAHVGATAVLFAGDDVTDEDAMRVLEPGDLGVRVGAGETAAVVRVADPRGIAALLDQLVELRASERGAPGE